MEKHNKVPYCFRLEQYKKDKQNLYIKMLIKIISRDDYEKAISKLEEDLDI